MIKLISTLVFVVAVISCEKKSSTPLSKEELKTVLHDLHLFEAKISNQLKVDSSEIDIQDGYDSLYSSHGVDEKDFQQTYTAYLKHYPEELDSIYTELLNEYQAASDSIKLSTRDLELLINKEDR